MKIFKNKIRFSFGITIFLIAAVLSAISFFSCEVGLGGAVDTQPPSITITNPPVDAVIRDNFAICGTYDDDGTIASVTAVLSRPDGRGSAFTFSNFTLTPDTENRGAGIWKIPVYTLDSNNNKIIVDGTYQATITIKDASGRTTIQNTTFTIDNTPPVIVLQRPGTDLNASLGNSPSPITFNSIYGGESYDARLEQPGCGEAGYDDRRWQQAVAMEGPTGKLRPETCHPVKIMERYGILSWKAVPSDSLEPASAKTRRTVDASAIVCDMGQNLAGFPSITMSGKRGQKVTMLVSERLTPQGVCDQSQTGRQHYYEYTLRGEGRETWHPRFSYYGFRYIQVDTSIVPSCRQWKAFTS